MLDFVKGVRENSWISLEIFTSIFPFLWGILGLILAFIWDLSAPPLPFFQCFNEVPEQAQEEVVVFPVAVVSFKPCAMHPIGDNTQNVTHVLVCCLLSLKKKVF